MKKAVCFILAAVMMLCFSACDMLGSLQSLIPTENEQLYVPTDPALDPDWTAAAPTEDIPQADIRIDLSAYSVTLRVGEAFQLTAAINVDKAYYWRSSNESVAVVNSQGTVTACSSGIASIVCYTDTGVESSCTVTVKDSSAASTQPSYPSYTSSDFIFPYSSHEYLSENEVYSTLYYLNRYSPTGKYAQDAINEIYARNGYMFQDSTLSAYYYAQDWYIPDPGFTMSDLNAYETANIALLQTFLPQ